MKRLYVAPLDVFLEHAKMGVFPALMTTHWMALMDPALEGDQARWEADGKPVVLVTEIASESAQDTWENHPRVTVLPDPVFDGSAPISDATEMPENTNTLKMAVRPVRRMASAAHGLTMAASVAPAGWGSSQDEPVEAPVQDVCEGVASLVAPTNLGVELTDTVVDVHKKLALVHPAFKLRSR